MQITLTDGQEERASDAHFLAAVEAGLEAALRGDFVEPSEVWAGVEEVLNP